MDWLVHQRPIEGTQAAEPTVGQLARDDVVSCRLGEPVGLIRERVRESPYPFAIVLSSSRVVLGRLPASRCAGDADQPVEQVMDPGPKTVRPHRTAQSIASDLADRNLRWVIVTTPDGELIGVASRENLEAAVKKRE